jgi:hypothetical protein
MITTDIYGIEHYLWKFANEIAKNMNLNIDLFDLRQTGNKTTVIYEKNVIGWIIEEITLDNKKRCFKSNLTFHPNK